MSGYTSVDDHEAELLDPRIQDELESLNTLTTEINELEKANDAANESFRNLLSQSAAQLKLVAADIGPKSIEKARSYYTALSKARDAQKLTQLAALEFQRANGIHRAAKETIRLAEAKFEEIQNSGFDAAWQEMLNHATLKVNESEAHKIESEQRHKNTAAEFTHVDRQVTHLENSLGRSLINRTRPYFEVKDKYNHLLEAQKEKIIRLQNDVAVRKEGYRGCLKRLERISEEIHRKRSRRKSSSVSSMNRDDITTQQKRASLQCAGTHSAPSILSPDPSQSDQTCGPVYTSTYPTLQEGILSSSSATLTYKPAPSSSNRRQVGPEVALKQQHSLEELDLEILKASASHIAHAGGGAINTAQHDSLPSPTTEGPITERRRLVFGEDDMKTLIDNIENISLSDLETATSVNDISKRFNGRRRASCPPPEDAENSAGKVDYSYKRQSTDNFPRNRSNRNEVIVCPANLFPLRSSSNE